MIGPSDTRLAQRKIRLNLSSIPNPLMNLRCLSPTALANSLSACSWTSTALAASNSFFFILSRIFFVYFIGAPWSLGTISRRSCSVLLSRASSSARKNFVVSAKDLHLASRLSYLYQDNHLSRPKSRQTPSPAWKTNDRSARLCHWPYP